MSVQQLLKQVLQSGQGLGQSAGSQLGELAKGSGLGGFGGGALAGGVLGVLLGNKTLRKKGGKIATYGAAAALGAVALKAYQNWQGSKQAGAASAPAPVVPSATPVSTPVALGWSEPELEHHSRVILSAMIAAAKADGHIGPQERQLIESELARVASSASDRAWFEAELQKPADPASIATLASTPEMAAEVYLASALVIDDESFMERAYLDELARQLNIDAPLKTRLEAQLKAL
ncbi:MAG: tellurite resistance TerB family protein [Alcaligenaceae bacterium]|nr:tellurite resistance TerB family protein [Alcaligenaceae bacterium]